MHFGSKTKIAQTWTNDPNLIQQCTWCHMGARASFWSIPFSFFLQLVVNMKPIVLAMVFIVLLCSSKVLVAMFFIIFFKKFLIWVTYCGLFSHSLLWVMVLWGPCSNFFGGLFFVFMFLWDIHHGVFHSFLFFFLIQGFHHDTHCNFPTS